MADLTRRDFHARLLGGAALAAGIAGMPTGLLAQPGGYGTKGKPPEPTPPGTTPPAPATPPADSFLDSLLKRGRARDMTLKVDVTVRSYQTPTTHIRSDQPVDVRPFKFTTAAIVFPVIAGTATSETAIDSVVSQVTFGDKDQKVEPVFKDGYPSGTRLGRWELRDKEGREIGLKLEIPMTCWETTFDEKGAAKAVWPAGGKWSKEAASALVPAQPYDAVQHASRNVKELLDGWTSGKSPQTQPPVVLAKYLAARMLDHVQRNGSGELYDHAGGFVGIDVQAVERTLDTKQGSEHDIACALCAVYRAAGLPARTVIGFDETAKKDNDSTFLEKKKKGGGSLRSWVEFALYDESADRTLWVPVDIVRQRGKSSRAPRADQPWKYFGSNDETDAILPFAFQFHPPTTVEAYGAPGFWGWFVTPKSQYGSQMLRFQSQTTPKRAAPKKKTGQ